MLARLWNRVEAEPHATPKALPPTDASYLRSQPTPPIIAPYHCPKRRQNRVRVCRLYPEPPAQPAIHALALLSLVQDECRHERALSDRPQVGW